MVKPTNNLEFQQVNKPATCTSPPWQVYIPFRDRPEILRRIRQETIDAYGISYDECPKRLTCFSKECLGRPLPWASKTAQPLLKQLVETHKTKLNPETNEVELLVSTDCRECPIYKSCTKPCNQALDYTGRDKSMEITLDYVETTDNLDQIEVYEPSEYKTKYTPADIPWHILKEKRRKIVQMKMFEHRDFRHIAEVLGLYNQAPAKYDFYSALTSITKYANIKEFVKNNPEKLTARQKEILDLYLNENLNYVEMSKRLGVSKQSIQQVISHVVKKHKIKWQVFVKKKGHKTIYNVPEKLKYE